MVYIVTTYMFIPHIVMVYLVMTYILMVYMVYITMACIVMVCTAYITLGVGSYSLDSHRVDSDDPHLTGEWNTLRLETGHDWHRYIIRCERKLRDIRIPVYRNKKIKNQLLN